MAIEKMISTPYGSSATNFGLLQPSQSESDWFSQEIATATLLYADSNSTSHFRFDNGETNIATETYEYASYANAESGTSYFESHSTNDSFISSLDGSIMSTEETNDYVSVANDQKFYSENTDKYTFRSESETSVAYVTSDELTISSFDYELGQRSETATKNTNSMSKSDDGSIYFNTFYSNVDKAYSENTGEESFTFEFRVDSSNFEDGIASITQILADGVLGRDEEGEISLVLNEATLNSTGFLRDSNSSYIELENIQSVSEVIDIFEKEDIDLLIANTIEDLVIGLTGEYELALAGVETEGQEAIVA